MGEEGEFYSKNITDVYWNMDDYPIPAAVMEDDLGFIRTNIIQVAYRMGFHGPKEVDVYCKRIKCDVKEKLSKAGINYLPPCTRTYMSAGVNKPAPVDMTSLMVRYALTVSGPYPLDLVVIAKPKEELDRVLKCLVSRGHNILFIDPTGYTASFFCVESLLGTALLLRPPPSRRSHLSYILPDDSSDLAEEDPSKIVDFLEPIIRPVKEDRTGVFWDAEDFPIPLFSTPDDIFDKIESALLERGFTDKLSIWVYLDDDDKKGTWRGDVLMGDKKWWASRIYFLPGGDKASRRIRMANDIIFWAKDSKYNRSVGSLILFSNQFKDDAEYTELLKNLSCNILSVIPTQDINKPESDPEWPGLLIDQAEPLKKHLKLEL